MSEKLKWWQETIAYEAYPRSFKDTTGNGTGDIKGIIEKLGYLESLGVGVLWLTPVCKSPMCDNGYDISDYTSIDPSFGTMEDMDELFAKAREHGIRIVMDLVFNHTSDEHPWFIESASSRDNPKSDWYVWRDGVDGKEPSNWRSIFGGSAWRYCPLRDQYCLHTFAPGQPDLNWANPDVRHALYDAARFWLDKGAGGFRIDAITYVKKPDEIRWSEKTDGEDGMISVHDMTANQPGILAYLHEFKREVCSGRDVFTVAEANGVGPDELKYWVGKDGAFDMLFEFSHINLDFVGIELWCKPQDWTISDLKKALRDSQEATRDNGWYPAFFENHDKPRSIDHFLPACPDKKLAAKTLATILLTLRGTPFVYQGEELGYQNASFASLDDYNDISTFGQFQYAKDEGFSDEEAMAAVRRFSRDNARTPMQWDDTPNAGFTSGKPWLGVHEDYRSDNVKAQAKDPDSVLSYYRALATLRKEHRALVDGDWQEIMADDPCVIAYRRANEQETIEIYANLSCNAITLDATGSVLMATGAYETGRLAPYEAVILAKS